MKKTISMILVTAMIFCLSGCGSENDSKFRGTWECFMDTTTYVVQFLEQNGDEVTVNYYSIDFYNSDQYEILDQQEGVVWTLNSDETVLSSDDRQEIVIDEEGLFLAGSDYDEFEKKTDDTPEISEYVKKYYPESIADGEDDYESDDYDTDDLDFDDFE